METSNNGNWENLKHSLKKKNTTTTTNANRQTDRQPRERDFIFIYTFDCRTEAIIVSFSRTEWTANYWETINKQNIKISQWNGINSLKRHLHITNKQQNYTKIIPSHSTDWLRLRNVAVYWFACKLVFHACNELAVDFHINKQLRLKDKNSGIIYILCICLV